MSRVLAPFRRAIVSILALLLAVLGSVVVTSSPAHAAAPVKVGTAASAATLPPTCTAIPKTVAAISADGTYRGLANNNVYTGESLVSAGWNDDHCVFNGTGYDPVTGALDNSSGLTVSATGTVLHAGVNTITITEADGVETRPFIANEIPPKTLTGRLYTLALLNHSSPFGETSPSNVGWHATDPAELASHFGTISVSAPFPPAVTPVGSCVQSFAPDTAPTGDTCTYTVNVPADAISFNGYIALDVVPRRIDPTSIENNNGFWKDGSAWSPANFTGIGIPIAYSGGPGAAFTDTPNGKVPGQFSFDASSSSGMNPTYAWDFGDGAKGTGIAITHNYTRPGTFKATLTVADSNGLSDTVEHDVVVAAPTLTTSLSFVDDGGNPLPTITPKTGDVVHYRVTVAASQDGVGNLSAVTFKGDPLTLAAGSTLVDVAGPTPALPKTITLKPGDSQSYIYDLTVKSAGVVRATTRATATDDSGAAVTSDQNQLSFGSSSLVVDLTVNPPTYKANEDADGNKQPIDVTVTEKLTNTSDVAISGLNVRSLAPGRVKSGQLLDVTFKSGVNPDPTAGYPLDGITIQPGESYTLPTPTIYTVKDDGKIQFSSLVTATNDAGTTLRGSGSVILTGTPDHYLEFTSRAVQGEGSGSLVPAGTPIEIQGTVRNLTDTATEDVGALFAKVAGNAGLQGLRYDGVGVDPKTLTTPGALTLDPGQSKQFTLKILTAYSEPAAQGGVKRSGGTRATIEFTPWATVHLDDGTDVTTADDYSDILTTDTQRIHNVSIDDSIYIPERRGDVVAGAILYGGIQGLWDGASGMVVGLASLPGLAASVLLAVVNAQNRIWDSFTQAQREQFSQSVFGAALPVFEANRKSALSILDNPEQKRAELDAFLTKYFTDVQNQAVTGNYGSEVALYSSYSTNAIAQVMIPIILGKLATSAAAIDSVATSQAELQAGLTTLAPAIDSSVTIQEVAGTLVKLANGVDLDYAQVAKLFGISEPEAMELQKLAAKYKWALTVRSRAASSIDWISVFQAEVKPELFKIKSVSALDIQLGYSSTYTGTATTGVATMSTEGMLIFKEPTPLIRYKSLGYNYTTNKNLAELTRLSGDFAVERGFVPGTADYNSAVARLRDRIDEWNEWNSSYQAWNKRKWVDLPFNWDGNKMTDPNFGGSGREVGFEMVPTGQPNEYVMKMFNGKAGRYVPITGDIDPIAFTHLDGSPLSPEEHAELIQEMRTNPLLRTQHGESATYMKGGVDFIAKQFKDGEPALQIGPDGKLRVVRFNAKLSTWTSPVDYNLVWDGGAIYAGAGEDNPAVLTIDYLTAGEIGPPAQEWLTLPGNGEAVGENVGRCSVRFTNAATAPSLLLNPAGQLVQVDSSATGVVLSPLEQTCFGEGGPIVVPVQPMTTIPGTITAGSVEIPVTPAGATSSGRGTATGFQVGQTVTIDPGTPVAETGTISAFGSIILSEPLKYTHNKGAIILRYTPQSLAGYRTVVTPPVAMTPPVAQAASASGGLAFTGVAAQRTAEYAALLIVLGGLLSSAGYRRRRPEENRVTTGGSENSAG